MQERLQERLLIMEHLLHLLYVLQTGRHEYIFEHIHAIVQQLDILHLRLIQLVSAATGHCLLVYRCTMNSALFWTIEYLVTVGTLERPFGRCLPISVQKQTRSEVRGQRSTIQQRTANLVVRSFRFLPAFSCQQIVGSGHARRFLTHVQLQGKIHYTKNVNFYIYVYNFLIYVDCNDKFYVYPHYY